MRSLNVVARNTNTRQKTVPSNPEAVSLSAYWRFFARLNLAFWTALNPKMSYYNIHTSFHPPGLQRKISVLLLKTKMILKELPPYDLLRKAIRFQVVSLFNFRLYLHADKASEVIKPVLPSFRDCVAVDTSPVTVVDATEGTDYRFEGENKVNEKNQQFV